MTLTIKRDMQLVRLTDGNGGPMELTIGATSLPGSSSAELSLHMEDLDAGTSTGSLRIPVAQLQAAIALVAMGQHCIED